jgi:hypothetical protein
MQNRTPFGTTIFLFTWVLEEVPVSVLLSGPDTSSSAPTDIRLSDASLEAAGAGWVPVTLAVGVGEPPGYLLGQTERRRVHQRMFPL